MHDHAHKLERHLRRAVEYELIPAPYRDPRYEPWSIDYWREWLLEPDKHEESLRPFTRALMGAFQEASYRSDLRAMDRILGVLDFGYRFCLDEPFRTAYENTMMWVNAMLADRHLAQGRLAACRSDLDLIADCLAEGNARRAELKMIP